MTRSNTQNSTKDGYDVIMNDLKSRLENVHKDFIDRADECKKRVSKNDNKFNSYYTYLSKTFSDVANNINMILHYLNSGDLDSALEKSVIQEKEFKESLEVYTNSEYINISSNSYNQEELFEIGMIISHHRYLAEVQAIHCIVKGWASALKDYKKFFM